MKGRRGLLLFVDCDDRLDFVVSKFIDHRRCQKQNLLQPLGRGRIDVKS